MLFFSEDQLEAKVTMYSWNKTKNRLAYIIHVCVAW